MRNIKQKKNFLIQTWQTVRKTETGVIIGTATIFITVFYGAWGVILTKKSNSLNQQMLELSKKQIELSNTQIQLSKTQNETSLDLKHFIKLLDKTDTIVSLSGSELILTRQQQNIANKNAEYTHLSEEGKFYLAYQNLESLLFQSSKHSSYLVQWDSTQRFNFLNNVDLILKSQLDNPYLLSNKYMFQEWLSVRDSIYHYTFNVNFYPSNKKEELNFNGKTLEESQKDLSQEWRNCFIAIGELEQNIMNYMLYYRWKRTKRPSPESYKSLEEFRKNGFKVRGSQKKQ
jgi:hypothetical protein